MRQNSFNLILRVVIEQGVGEDDSSSRSQAGKRGIRLLAFFGEMPLVNSPNTRAGALAKHD